MKIDYALVVMGVALAAFTAVEVTGTSVRDLFDRVANMEETENVSIPPQPQPPGGNDDTPNAFSFSAANISCTNGGWGNGATVTSSTATISGFDNSLPVSASLRGYGGYAVSPSRGAVTAGDNLSISLTNPAGSHPTEALNNQRHNVDVAIGNTNATWQLNYTYGTNTGGDFGLPVVSPVETLYDYNTEIIYDFEVAGLDQATSFSASGTLGSPVLVSINGGSSWHSNPPPVDPNCFNNAATAHVMFKLNTPVDPEGSNETITFSGSGGLTASADYTTHDIIPTMFFSPDTGVNLPPNQVLTTETTLNFVGNSSTAPSHICLETNNNEPNPNFMPNIGHAAGTWQRCGQIDGTQNGGFSVPISFPTPIEPNKTVVFGVYANYTDENFQNQRTGFLAMYTYTTPPFVLTMSQATSAPIDNEVVDVATITNTSGIGMVCLDVPSPRTAVGDIDAWFQESASACADMPVLNTTLHIRVIHSSTVTGQQQNIYVKHMNSSATLATHRITIPTPIP